MQPECDSLLALLITTSMRDQPIGTFIDCEVLAAPMDPDVGDDAGWRAARLGVQSGIVQLSDDRGAGIINHDHQFGLTLFVRLPGRQIELALAEPNRVDAADLAHVRALVPPVASLGR
ncbi:hypothetical protein [Paraburkholderia sp. SIMBA_054]|uniref:hypothetical protein n=1 Tax=Paraburkholderia sp. SIMBA_054 TaxID=3085795 RepID=UPI00397E17DE